MNELFDWSVLGTAAGVATAVVALTQILKQYVPRIDPKWIALSLSALITFGYQLITGDYSAGAFLLSALNAILSAGAAIGAYEAVVAPVEKRGRRRPPITRARPLVAVDSGHGMETAGKRTPPLPEDLVIGGRVVRRKGEVIHEKEFNRAAADALIAALNRCGIDTIDVSPGTRDVSLANRYNAANNAGADLFISKHYNARGGAWWTGGYLVGFVAATAGANTRAYANFMRACAVDGHEGKCARSSIGCCYAFA